MNKGSNPMKNSWKDITVGDLIRIKDIDALQLATDDEKNLHVASLLAGIPYEEMLNIPLNEVRTYMDNTEFLLHEPQPSKVKRTYEINGRKYKLHKKAENITVAQYLDLQQLMPDGFEKRPGELLSIMLIPDGHEYNDGYDKDQVIEDMYELGVEEALGITGFFISRLARLTKAGLTYLKLRIKWMRLTARKEDREMWKALEIQMNLMADELECMYGSLASRRYPS